MAACPPRGVIIGGTRSQDGVSSAQASPAGSTTTAQARATLGNQLDCIQLLLRRRLVPPGHRTFSSWSTVGANGAPHLPLRVQVLAFTIA
ncbi:hypothetical protein BE11_40670 [Sorangium cellulosum]|nr:hypothetical protein BE11_40670 [Sorangium cellulosum]